MSLFETIMICEFFIFTVVGVAYAFMYSPSYLKKGDPFKRDMWRKLWKKNNLNHIVNNTLNTKNNL